VTDIAARRLLGTQPFLPSHNAGKLQDGSKWYRCGGRKPRVIIEKVAGTLVYYRYELSGIRSNDSAMAFLTHHRPLS
jgi:hypothetical protein